MTLSEGVVMYVSGLGTSMHMLYLTQLLNCDNFCHNYLREGDVYIENPLCTHTDTHIHTVYVHTHTQCVHTYMHTQNEHTHTHTSYVHSTSTYIHNVLIHAQSYQSSHTMYGHISLLAIYY